MGMSFIKITYPNSRRCERSEAIWYRDLTKHRSGLLRQGSQRRNLPIIFNPMRRMDIVYYPDRFLFVHVL